MAEQTFRSPGFFEQEIDLSAHQQSPVGTPGGVVGTSTKGPAFVPVTVGSFADFTTKMGDLDPKKFGPYAVKEFLKHKTALTYVRVLGAGANDSTTDLELTRLQGTVRNAGFKLVSALASQDASGRHMGAVQFIAAKHFVSASEAVGYPSITHNDSLGATVDDFIYLIRAMIFVPSGTRVMLLNNDASFTPTSDDVVNVSTLGEFKLVISSSSPGFGTTDSQTGLKIMTASLNPASTNYISKILNTDPEKFVAQEHYLYADFSLENEIAGVSTGESNVVAVLSGSASSSNDSGDTTAAFRDLFGRFDTRYASPKTTKFISQPFGKTEFDLFHIECIDDGAYANGKYKISVTDLKRSSNQKDPYGTFSIVVRSFADTDTAPQILERFPNLSLNPRSENYVARRIGDKKVYFNFDADKDDDRRLVISGKYPNRSNIIRIVIDPAVEKAEVPAEVLPFGFRGISVIKTSDGLTDTEGSPLVGLGATTGRRVTAVGTGASSFNSAIVPPLPFRFKVTKGSVNTSGGFVGNPGSAEVVDGRYHWGVKFESVPSSGTLANAIYNPNVSNAKNPLIESYTKFLGIQRLDVLVTGSGADAFNSNKFTLARVAFSNSAVTALTSSVKDHMLEAAYIRNGVPNSSDYTINDGVLSRITFATLASLTSSVDFNRFTEFAKFSTVIGGGFDGVNILDSDAARLNDKSSSSDTGGGAATAFVSPGLLTNVNGTGRTNNAVNSYRTAVRLMTDPMVARINVMAIPGIRDPFVIDDAMIQVKDYSLALLVIDPVEYDEDGVRLFDNDTKKPDVRKTKDQFESRAIDNSYAAAYFPDVVIDDTSNNRKVSVPPSVAALGALAFNDKASYPWFAPAGFNRGGLDFVSNVDVRLNSADRDSLYAARINPIATFPREGFVVWGQKTLQQAQTSLDRVNVRRLMLEIKRLVADVAKNFVFEQNTSQTRKKFVSKVTPLLAIIQTQSGVNKFAVIMDGTNNTQSDVDANRLNGKIIIYPTKTVEFVAVDFIISNSGVDFS